MITQCTVWRGYYVQLYQEQLDDWCADSDPASLRVVRCRDVDPNDVDCDLFTDEQGLFGGVQSYLIMAGEGWYAATMAKTLKRFQQMDTEIRLAITYQTEEPCKAVADLADEVIDMRLDTDAESMTKWGLTWLRDRGVLVSRKAMSEAVRRAGNDDLEVLIDAIMTLINGFQGRIDDDRFLGLIDGYGVTEGYHLTGAICSGNRAEAMEILARLHRTHPLALVSMLTGQFRMYLILASSPDTDITTLFRVTPGRVHYLRREALRLGQSRALEGYNYLLEADCDLKGGSTLDQRIVLEILTDRLSRLFAVNRSAS